MGQKQSIIINDLLLVKFNMNIFITELLLIFSS